MTARPVVVGVDGSEESLRAVEWAAREAHRHAAPLRIVSAPAMPPRMWASDPAPYGAATVLGGVPRRALAEAVTRAGEVAPDVPVDTELLAGPPALAVTDSGSGALLLVVGARGAGGFAAMLLGSVSRYAAMHACCPVAVVREETSVVYREVVVGIRDPLDTTATLPFAFEEAALRGATLIAVLAWNWVPSPFGNPEAREPMTHPAAQATVSADAGQHLAENLRRWREKYPDVPVREDIVHGHPARVLASYTARADLVVVGRHDGQEIGPAVGAVQHGVLNHAHGPVLIVPAQG